MKPVFLSFLFAAVLFNVSSVSGAVSTKDFADASGMVPRGRNLLERMLFYYDLVGKYTVPLKGIDYKKAAKDPTVVWALERLIIRYGDKKAYTIAELDTGMPPKASGPEIDKAKSEWQKIAGVTEPYVRRVEGYGPATDQKMVFSGRAAQVEIDKSNYEKALPKPVFSRTLETRTMGPIRLRRKSSAIMETGIELEKSVANADLEKGAIEGAKISFANDRLTEGNGAWSSEGALLWPVRSLSEPTPTSSFSWDLGPAISWKIEEQEKAGKTDINEVKFSFPIGIHSQPGVSQFEYFAQLEPFYHTDTHFDGEIAGVSGSLEFRTGWLGNFQPFSRAKIGNAFTESGEMVPPDPSAKPAKGGFYYRARLTGLADYSSVEQESRYSPRKKGDDWARVGAEAAVDFSYVENSEKNYTPFTALISYRFMDDFSGEGGYSSLFKANTTYWLNRYAGLTLEYQKGDTPVADKEIDLFTFGLQLRY